jgi:hypothetical protein
MDHAKKAVHEQVVGLRANASRVVLPHEPWPSMVRRLGQVLNMNEDI